MVLIKDMDMPRCCSECLLCDNYCLLLRCVFDVNPNIERDTRCPLLDVYVNPENLYLTAVMAPEA